MVGVGGWKVVKSDVDFFFLLSTFTQCLLSVILKHFILCLQFEM